MIVAMFCVAAAMVAGGAWAVFTGWELIIIERGWTQVLLGGMLITGGLLLGGLGVLATHVKRLASKLDRLPGNASSPTLVSDFGFDKRESIAPQPGTRPRVEAPIVPPPPRPEPRAETAAEPAAEPEDRQAGPATSAPAIAPAAAAAAGTGPIWSSLLASDAQGRPEDEAGAGQAGEPRNEEAPVEEALVEEAPAEDELVEGPFAREAAPEIEEAETPAALGGGFPTPDGEDSEMLWAAEGSVTSAEEGASDDLAKLSEAEDLEAETLEAEAAKSEGLRGDEAEVVVDAASEAGEYEAGQFEAEQVEAEHVIPPIEEPAAAPVAWREAETEPEFEPDLYSAPAEEEETTPDAEATPVLEEAASDLAEPLHEPLPKEEGRAEAPEEQPERMLVGTYESGGNIYTMYSDGSIDAQTPTGNFHFASLDELKNFIAQGGEDPLA